MLVGVNQGEHHTLQIPSSCASDDLEKTEFDPLPIRRHLPFKVRAISGVTIMGSEQTIPVQVEHRDFMLWGTPASCIPLMQNCSATRSGANCEVDRHAHNRSLPETG